MSTGIGIGIAGDTFQTRAGLASAGGGSTLLLDLYGSDVLAAYSFRKLSSSYTGSAVRVRKVPTLTEQDIGFDSDGNLDTAALTSFLGTEDGFITVWYDQSGNGRNGTQLSASRQIRIATAGVIETKNSLPTTQGGNNDCLIISGIPLTAQPITSFEVYAHNTATAAGNSQTFAGYSVLPPSGTFIANRVHRFVRYGMLGAAGAGAVQCFTGNNTNTDLHVITRMANGSSSLIRVDQSAQALGNTPPAGATIGGANLDRIGETSTNAYNGQLSEVIVFAADKTSDFTGIETDIQTYYSIP